MELVAGEKHIREQEQCKNECTGLSRERNIEKAMVSARTDAGDGEPVSNGLYIERNMKESKFSIRRNAQLCLPSENNIERVTEEMQVMECQLAKRVHGACA